MSGMMVEGDGADDCDREPDYQDRIDEITGALKAGHVGYEPVLQFFGYGHLKEEQKEVSKLFARMAIYMIDSLPPNTMRETALGQLLLSKDAAVRSSLQVTTNRLR